MNKRTLACLIITILLLSGSFTPGIAREAKPLSVEKSNRINLAGGAPWRLQYIDGNSNKSVGAYPSVLYNRHNGLPYISYYDITNGDLLLANPVLEGGSNCGEEGNWRCQFVYNANDVGKYNSIAFWVGSGPLIHWKLGISFFNQGQNALMYAVYTCIGFNCGWEIETVNIPDPANLSVGLYTSLKFTLDGSPGIAYYVSNPTGDDALLFAYPVLSYGNCGTGVNLGLWNCDTVDSGEGVGKYASLDRRVNGSAYIVYYDEGQGNLKYAYYVDDYGNCGAGDRWACGVIDGTDGSDVGLYASLKAPQYDGDLYRIAYYDKTHGQLKIAYSETPNGFCSSGWQCDVVDDMGTSMYSMGISMAVDKSGNPIIAYQQIASDQSKAVLRIARPAPALGLVYGNCGDGPPEYSFQYWFCETLDNASAYTNEAEYVSVALDADGMAIIAYSEYDEYGDFYRLKVAYQTPNYIYLPSINKAISTQ
jgi:hypothetical protein